jgi:hypothetical protein
MLPIPGGGSYRSTRVVQSIRSFVQTLVPME